MIYCSHLDPIARIFRAESGQVLASLTYFCGDIQMAEDAMQEAFVQASSKWLGQGIPKNPGAWLHLVAKRKLIDTFRQSQKHHHLAQTLEQSLMLDKDNKSENDYDVSDERLRLIFTCCHPALNPAAQVALTLRTLCGLQVREIARAYLTSEVAMGQRITRAKKKIKDAGIAYQVPDKEQLDDRLPSVLKVIYLIYNESYSVFEGQTLTRHDLAAEALRLSVVMVNLMPHPEVMGLAALLALHDARRASRSSASDGFIPLEHQDRTLWDKNLIRQGTKLLEQAMTYHQAGPYQIQAAISALHVKAKSWQTTDWKQIYLLYRRLLEMAPSAVVALNCAVAKANKGELQSAYQDILSLGNELQAYQPYYAARSELESRLCFHQLALDSITIAIKLTANNAERDFLRQKQVALKQLAQ